MKFYSFKKPKNTFKQHILHDESSYKHYFREYKFCDFKAILNKGHLYRN